MKTALITGIAGQDGTYLYKYLMSQSYSISGVDISSFAEKNVDFIENINICDFNDVIKLINKVAPQEIYHLAAYHGSSEDKIEDELDLFEKSYDINILSTLNILEAIRKYSPQIKLFCAASSQLFGPPVEPMQDEFTPFNPSNIYGITKHTSTKLCHYYRNKYKLFASVGILYAHESPLRGSNFVSKKIIVGSVAIKYNKQKELILGNLESEMDWGYAGDYVVAMHKILQLRKPDDFIISSGKKHTVRDFVEIVFDYLNLDLKKYIVVNNDLLTSKDKFSVLGDNRKLINFTGWYPTIDFRQLVIMMIEAEIKKQSIKL